MSDFIKRSDAIRIINENYGEEYFTDAIIELIEEMPSIDMREDELGVSVESVSLT